MTKPKESYFSSNCNSYESAPLPRHDDGDFLSLDYDNPVRENGIVATREPEIFPHASFHFYDVTMENGYRYNVVSTEIPDKLRRAGSDIPHIETTAFLTRPEGLNKRRMHALAKLAIPTTFVSVQQNLDKIGHIDRNAHNLIEINKAMADRHEFSARHATGGGVSRGGMNILNAHAVAKQHGVEMIHSDALVPCYPDRVDIWSDVKQFIRSPHSEFSATLAAIRDVPLSIMMRYPSTADISLRGLFQQIKEAPTLLSGVVGEQIDEHMDHDAFVNLVAYRGDVMSKGERWQEIFNPADYPNAVVDLKDGGAHMSCITNSSHLEWQNRTATIAELLHENHYNRYLGATAFRALAAERNPVFRNQNDTPQPVDLYVI